MKRGQIPDQRHTGTDHSPLTDPQTLDDGRTAGDEGIIANDNPATQGGCGCNMNMTADPAVVIDARSGVDDRIFTYAAVRLHDCTGHDLYTFTQEKIWRNPGYRMHQHRKAETPGLEPAVQITTQPLPDQLPHAQHQFHIVRIELIKVGVRT